MAVGAEFKPKITFLYGHDAQHTKVAQMTSLGPRINMRFGSAAICETNQSGELSVCAPCPIKKSCEFFKSKSTST